MRHRVKMWTLLGLGFAGLALAIQPAITVAETPASPGESRFVDHSLMISKEFPNNWPTNPFPRFHLIHEKQIGPTSPYNVDVLLLDGNTGTQLDVPPHSVARPELKREKSGPFGLAFTDQIEPWQFGGEACVVDVRSLLDQAPNGVSPLVTADHVRQFEQQHRPVKFGDVVLFRSDYCDRYYLPLPEGSRFISGVIDRKVPGFPDPDPDCMEYLGQKGVLTLGTDSASMGPLPDLAEPTHYAGLKYGMIWTESAMNLGQIPQTGAFYLILAPKQKGEPYSASRVFSIVGGNLPARLIEATRNRRAVDLSTTLDPDLPLTNPGVETGHHRQLYLRLNFLYNDYLDFWHATYLTDSMAGTHLVPPSYALPLPDQKPDYSPEVRGWLEEYEKKYGPRGTSTMTAEQIPLEWTCGPARVIDVRSLAGTTNANQWPASPEITPQQITDYEAKFGKLRPGDVVLFQTGWTKTHLRPNSTEFWQDPLSGKREGWPAPGPEAIQLLKQRGIRCIGIDAPDLGGVDPRKALMTYWMLGTQEMIGVEFLQAFDKIPQDAYFLSAGLKIRDCHGVPGRAIVLY